MYAAPIPLDEEQRLETVHRIAILDTEPEDRYDKYTREATSELKVPISTISILDSNREWFKSCVGLDQREGERAISFCGHALVAKDMFIVPDTLRDERFKDNPMVIGKPYIRFYAGQALLDYKTGQPIGVFCIKDIKPRNLSMDEISIFMDLANKVEQEINK